jgi:hypothetical protein
MATCPSFGLAALKRRNPTYHTYIIYIYIHICEACEEVAEGHGHAHACGEEDHLGVAVHISYIYTYHGACPVASPL